MATDPVRPCTSEPTEVTVVSGSRPLTFVDLPGVGESSHADPVRLAAYGRYLRSADVIIWALHADSRSLAGDVGWLQGLLDGVEQAQRPAVLSRISFVLTKSDLVHVDPWIVPLDGFLPSRARVQPGPRTAALLAQKCHHVQEVLLGPFVEHLRPSTHNDGGPAVEDGPLSSDRFTVRLTRPVSKREVAELALAHPALAAAIGRLAGSALPAACSSVLRHNLAAVMTAVVDRVEAVAIRRLTAHLDIDHLDVQDADVIMDSANLMALDLRLGRQFRLGPLVADALVSSVGRDAR